MIEQDLRWRVLPTQERNWGSTFASGDAGTPPTMEENEELNRSSTWAGGGLLFQQVDQEGIQPVTSRTAPSGAQTHYRNDAHVSELDQDAGELLTTMPIVENNGVDKHLGRHLTAVIQRFFPLGHELRL